MQNVTPAQQPVTTSNPNISGAVEVVPQRTSRRTPIVIAAGVGVLALVAAVVAIAKHDDKTAQQTTASTSAASPPPATTVAAQPKSTKPIRRVLVVDPRDAVVTVDGARVAKDSPWIEGTRSVLVHVEASGRAPRDLTVGFETDDPLVIELAPLPASTGVAMVVATSKSPRGRPVASASASTSSAPPPVPTESPTDVGY
jgi:hypothetical protein